MEIKEAIELLDNLLGMIEDNHGNDYDEALHMAISALEKQVAQIIEIEGLSVDRMKELAKAEAEERLVVLPCKVGNTVYLIKAGRVLDVKVESIHQWVSGHWKVSARTLGAYFASYEIDFDGFGKIVFLSREEAEAALRKEQGE